MARSNRDISILSTPTRSSVCARSLRAPRAAPLWLWFVAAALLVSAPVWAQPAQSTPASAPGDQANVLKVCADPNNLPQSDKDGQGYENKLAEALARDLGKRVEYTFFPQRMGFVRNTLRARDDQTRVYKCDVIIGVPKGYELTATTRPYMRSVYAMVVPPQARLGSLSAPEDLLKLPQEKLQSLRIGIFARTPPTDWLLQNGLIDRAVLYPAQSGDPDEHPANVIERDLEAGKIDLAMVWGPVAGFLADRHKAEKWTMVPFKPDPRLHFDYEIAMGVRFGEDEWRKTLDDWIATHGKDIEQILVSYRIPLLQTSGSSGSSR